MLSIRTPEFAQHDLSAQVGRVKPKVVLYLGVDVLCCLPRLNSFNNVAGMEYPQRANCAANWTGQWQRLTVNVVPIRQFVTLNAGYY